MKKIYFTEVVLVVGVIFVLLMKVKAENYNYDRLSL